MRDINQISLVQMQSGQSGTVINIEGGHGIINRLNTLGIVPGKKITKISSVFMGGPVTIEIDRAKVALGFGMAKRIMVRLSNRKNE